ncbi:serine/threonine-protein kinase [Thermomonospora umbrina]|uniref:Serine/threonine protein kinase n=1 Tax=Thermomonospora umbrina TaxID=111806 RepID=A0A3D9SWA8_9ACTN|nr:serine/threonine-protein kinase [Thermomonospora umbrina]REE98303.1 serine/threonine protein kinase [Thermomonospora umbrina]
MVTQPLRPEDPQEIGSYRLLGRLGGGGMGQVFLGRSPGGRPVAVKLVLPGLAADSDFRRRFAQEIDAARRVGGFHTAQLVDADPHSDPPWLVTAYVPGPSLQDAIETHGPLPERTVRALGAGLAEGLGAIHACGLVHRDLKPGNVILAEDGPRIIDFGIARAMGSTMMTAAGSVMGTPGFMSPEQAEGAQDLGPASDVFALGSVLTYAATGEGPFDAGSIASIVYRIIREDPDLGPVPASLRALVGACLAKDPAARPGIPDVLRYLSDASGTSEAWLPAPVTAMIAERNLGTGPSAASPQPPPPPATPPPFPVTPAHGAPVGSGAPGMLTPPPFPVTPAPFPLTPAPGVPAQYPGGGWTPSPAPAPAPAWQQQGPTTPSYGPPGPGTPSPTGPRLVAVGVAVLAVLVLVIVGVLVVATNGDDDPRAETSQSTGADNDPPPAGEAPGTSVAPVLGAWTGTYTCTQGLTNLSLLITEAAGGGLEATFRFSAHPSNPSVPNGSFVMKGSFTNGVLDLNGDRWLQRPGSYLMVDIKATNITGDRPLTINGVVDSTGSECSTFSIRRV